MKSVVLPVLLGAGVMAGVIAFHAETVPAQTDAQSVTLPDTPETAVFVRLCGDCHDTERSSSRRRTRAEWKATIEQMIEDGAEGSDDEFAAVLDFLVGNFGAVSVNSARAEELVTVLHISKRDADAIVAYRTANGPFADFEALKAVKGIDLAPIDARRSSLRFF